MKLYEIQASIFKVLDEHFENVFLENKKIGVGDSFSEDTPLPFIFLGEMNQSRLDTKTTKGKEINQTIHVFSHFSGKEQAFEIAEKVEQLLNQDLKIEGTYVIHNEVSSVRVFEATAQYVEAQLVVNIQIEQEEY